MYDSLSIWQDRSNIKDCGYMHKVPTLLTNVIRAVKENGVEFYTGNFENMRISVSDNGLSLKGSLNKFWHTDNFCKLTRVESQFAIEKLEDCLGVSLCDAKLTRIDVANNFIMKNDVKQYYYYLGESRYYKRFNQPDSVYYNNNLRTKLFYNKVKEGAYRGLEIPQIWNNRNVLRYELRYMQRLNQQFKKDKILVSCLYDENFYMAIIDNWINEYLEIKKNRLLLPNANYIMTNKDAKDYLLSALVEVVGLNKVSELTEHWKTNFSTPKEAQRFKKSLSELKGLTEESPLMLELDEKILRVKEFYR